MEGFLKIQMPPWARRLLTRLIAIIPAATVAAVLGNEAVGKLLVLSQVLLSLTLTFAVVPLVQFTNTPSKMKEFTNPLWIKIIGILIAIIIAGLNAFLVVISIKDNSFGTA
jgi:manganese transport protein